MSTEHAIALTCPRCRHRLRRVRREDGTYGVCPRCGAAPLHRETAKLDRRLERARIERARIELAARRPR